MRSLDFYWGNRKAIYDRPSAEGSEDGFTGRLAWLLWRSAYFTMTLSGRNKYVSFVILSTDSKAPLLMIFAQSTYPNLLVRGNP